MDATTFWSLIDRCRPSGRDRGARRLAQALIDRLSEGPVEDTVAFAEHLSEAMARLGRAPLRHDLEGDEFLYRRAAVVAAGREEYERILADPARFADSKDDTAQCLLLVPDRAYQQLTGRDWRRGHRYSYEQYHYEAGLPAGPDASDDDLIAAIRQRVAGRGLPPPASAADIAEFEHRVGHPMPALLRRLYLEVGNGGFGIWSCLSLTTVDAWFGDFEDLAEAYRIFSLPADDPWDESVPKGVVPLMDRGCCMWTMVDFRTPEGRIWDWDANDCCTLTPTTLTLADWLKGWLEGWIIPGPYSELRVHPAGCPDAGPGMSPEQYRERKVRICEPGP
ncbi:DUF4240 domain-containing protein [Streptomyces griseosporeus]